MLDYNDRATQRRIRVEFFDQYGSQQALTTVAVRRDPGDGGWFLDVGVTGNAPALPGAFEGLAIREQQVGRARHAVLQSDHMP